MAQRNTVLKYPEAVVMCPACKEHTVWNPLEGLYLCNCCGWKEESFRGIKSQKFIREDIVDKMIDEAIRQAR